MKAKKIEVVKNWPKPKLVYNIQVFLSFANFYQRFIQSFNRIAALLILMLKSTRSPNEPALNKNNGSKSAFSRNDNSKPASRRNNGDGEVNRFSISRNSVEHAKKSRRLSKSGKSKSEKISKSQNLAKSEKKLSISGNSTNFDTTKTGSNFLTSDTKTTFNCLWLAFTKASIL